MNNYNLNQIARDNWYLLVALASIGVVVAYNAVGFGAQGPAAVELQADSTSAAGAEDAMEPEVDAAVEARDRERAATLAKIRENETALAAGPEPEVAAAYINGNGNMYFQRLEDYASAASNYERVISDYPNAPAVYQSYVNLATCYEKLNDVEKRKSTLRRMLEAFPADSQQYAYAYSELYGKMPPAAAPEAQPAADEPAPDDVQPVDDAAAQPISVASAQ